MLSTFYLIKTFTLFYPNMNEFIYVCRENVLSLLLMTYNEEKVDYCSEYIFSFVSTTPIPSQ